MVTLPELDSYSKSDRKQLGEYSPIFKHYCQLLEKAPLQVSDEIRIEKHRRWLECALATYCSDISSEKICQFWSEITEELLLKCWKICELPEKKMTLLAFGKLGSRELNLSSDIDIVFVKSNGYEEENLTGKIRQLIKLVSETTLFGFAYRVDLNLRPGGEHSPLVPSKENFYNYFDEYLEAWHRLSFIRTRALWTPSKLSSDLISYCQKRSFPKRLDFSIINEIKSVRSKINLQWRKAHEPFDIKLHPGGIRDIELYIHSLQVIYGGRNKMAQVAGMTDAIVNLTNLGALSSEDAQFLLSFYWKLRSLENLIHIQNDQHTYLVQKKDFDALKSKGFDANDLEKDLNFANALISDFFNEEGLQPGDSAPPPTDLSVSSQKAIDDILQLKSRSIKKSGVQSLKNEIIHLYVEKAKDIAIDQDLAIQIFKDFIFAIKSKTTIFHLLARNPQLLDELAWLFSVSPYAGQLLSRRPELIDSFVLGQVIIDEKEDLEVLWESLVDYKLLGQLTTIVEFFKNGKIESYLQSLSQQADFIVHHLMKKLGEIYAAEPLDILCMGKWSGFELGIRSDLDFVFLADSPANADQLKMAKRLITLLTSLSPAGRLYEIDLRLKPNENAGPLIVEKSFLLDFLNKKAEPWQKQAYLKSRLINQSEFFLSDHFKTLKINKAESTSLQDILEKLLSTSPTNSIDIKYSEGGLIDSEFVTQKHCILGDRVPEACDFQNIVKSLELGDKEKTSLIENYWQLRAFEQVFQICNDSSSTKVSKSNENLKRVARMLALEDPFSHLTTILREQRENLKALDLSP